MFRRGPHTPFRTQKMEEEERGRERRKQEGSLGLLILEACAVMLAVRGRWPNTHGHDKGVGCPYVQKLLSMSSLSKFYQYITQNLPSPPPPHRESPYGEAEHD